MYRSFSRHQAPLFCERRLPCRCSASDACHGVPRRALDRRDYAWTLSFQIPTLILLLFEFRELEVSILTAISILGFVRFRVLYALMDGYSHNNSRTLRRRPSLLLVYIVVLLWCIIWPMWPSFEAISVVSVRPCFCFQVPLFGQVLFYGQSRASQLRQLSP